MLKKAILLFFLFPFALFAKVGENGDFEIWNENILHFKVDPKVTSILSVEFRWADHAKTLYYKHIQNILACDVNPYVSIRPGYLMIWLRANNNWTIVYDPFFEVLLQLLDSKHLTIYNRHRITYSVVPNELGGKNAFQYRNRIHFHVPITLGGYQFKIFAGDEVFFREGRGFAQNRAMFGFIFPRSERANFEIFYVYRNVKKLSKVWVHHNILRLSASFFF